MKNNKTIFIDQQELKSLKLSLDDPFVDHNGYLWVTARITRLGLMAYQNQDKPGVHQELKSEKELFKKDTIASFVGVPVTIEHPFEGLVTPETYNLLSVGHTMSVPTIDEAYYLKARIQITKQDTINEVIGRIENNQTYEVSCGYSADLEWKAGQWNGQDYDAIQTNIIFNHLALVREGRAGPEVKILYGENNQIQNKAMQR